MTCKQFMWSGETQWDFTAITNMTTHHLENPVICFYSEGERKGEPKQESQSVNLKVIDFLPSSCGITATAVKLPEEIAAKIRLDSLSIKL